MTDPLAPLLADGVIDEIVARLKSGKEADVWLVRHGEEIVAAKVYKARHARNFKNNAAYKEGRQVRNTRTQRAMDRGSRFGQEAAEDAWKAKESDALHRLHAAGVRVPRPVLFFEGVLLMEVVVDASGHPAPRLIDAQVAPEQAATMYADLRRQAIGMLACDLIHGDLSPYNVLVGAGGPVVIDFPQVVGAAHNSQAEAFFLRDLQNIHRHLAGLDPALKAAEGDGREIWRAYVRRELTVDFVPTGRAPEPQRQRREEGPRREVPRAPQPRPPHGHGRGPQPQVPAPHPEPRERQHPRQGQGQHPHAGHAHPPRQGPEQPPRQAHGAQQAHGQPPRQGHGQHPHPAQGQPPGAQGQHPRQAQGPHPRRDEGPGRRPERGGPQGARPQRGPPEKGAAPPHAGAHPQGASRGQPGGSRPEGSHRPARHASGPEVIRVVRLDRPPHGGGSGPGGTPGGAGGASGPGPGPVGRRRRRGGRR
jgi:RIO kinase 1